MDINIGIFIFIHHKVDGINYSNYLVYRLGNITVEATISEGSPIAYGLSVHSVNLSLLYISFLVDCIHWASCQCSLLLSMHSAVFISFLSSSLPSPVSSPISAPLSLPLLSSPLSPPLLSPLFSSHLLPSSPLPSPLLSPLLLFPYLPSPPILSYPILFYLFFCFLFKIMEDWVWNQDNSIQKLACFNHQVLKLSVDVCGKWSWTFIVWRNLYFCDLDSVLVYIP